MLIQSLEEEAPRCPPEQLASHPTTNARTRGAPPKAVHQAREEEYLHKFLATALRERVLELVGDDLTAPAPQKAGPYAYGRGVAQWGGQPRPPREGGGEGHEDRLARAMERVSTWGFDTPAVEHLAARVAELPPPQRARARKIYRDLVLEKHRGRDQHGGVETGLSPHPHPPPPRTDRFDGLFDSMDSFALAAGAAIAEAIAGQRLGHTGAEGSMGVGRPAGCPPPGSRPTRPRAVRARGEEEEDDDDCPLSPPVPGFSGNPLSSQRSASGLLRPRGLLRPSDPLLQPPPAAASGARAPAPAYAGVRPPPGLCIRPWLAVQSLDKSRLRLLPPSVELRLPPGLALPGSTPLPSSSDRPPPEIAQGRGWGAGPGVGHGMVGGNALLSPKKRTAPVPVRRLPSAGEPGRVEGGVPSPSRKRPRLPPGPTANTRRFHGPMHDWEELEHSVFTAPPRRPPKV
jgi:hypothetical protein